VPEKVLVSTMSEPARRKRRWMSSMTSGRVMERIEDGDALGEEVVEFWGRVGLHDV